MKSLLYLTTIFVIGLVVQAAGTSAFELTPSDEEIQKYRKYWNPLSNGPNLVQMADTQPKGQLSIRPFLFSQVGERQYGNQLTVNDRPAKTHLYQLSPQIIAGYGLSSNMAMAVALGADAFWARNTASPGNPDSAGGGFGDLAIQLLTRHVVQNPETWRPTITNYLQLGLPTDKWTGASTAPGGFLPLGRLPATRAGAIGLTEGVLLRKNVQPFRISGGVYYTYTAPGSESGRTTYPGDLINTRLAVEHILDDDRGFGYAVEMVGLHGVPFRADGHSVDVKPSSSNVIGVGPTLQYKFSDNWLAGAGVLFTVAGQNAIGAIYPNFSIYYYYQESGKIIMR